MSLRVYAAVRGRKYLKPSWSVTCNLNILSDMDEQPQRMGEFLTQFPRRDLDDCAMFIMQLNDFELVLSAKASVVIHLYLPLVT